MFQGPGENEILPLFLQREDARGSKTPRLGWVVPLLPPGRDSEGRAAVAVPVWDAAVLPNHRNRRRQLLAAVTCCRDGSSKALTSSLLPPLTSHLFVNFSPHLPSACLMLGVGRQGMRGLDAIKLPQKGGIYSQFCYVHHRQKTS